MPGVKNILRKAAVEKMSSPEQLDMAMRVTLPVSWAAVAAIAVMILAGGVYCVVGRVPVRVSGNGILLPTGGVKTVQVKANGTVKSLEVVAGDRIREGQVVARLDLSISESEIRAARGDVIGLDAQYNAQLARSDDLRDSLAVQIAALRDRRRRVERLVAQKIRTPSELDKIDGEIGSLQSRSRQLDVADAQLNGRLEEARRKLRQLEESQGERMIVTSPHSGVVTAVLKPVGQSIRAGERLINIQEQDAELRAFLFVPFAQGAKVGKGMEVRIGPSTVKSEEFGFVLGRVDERSSQPVTLEELKTLLQNDALAEKYIKNNPYQVVAIPETTDECEGGLRWTSSCGPPEPIGANTPCSGQVIIEHRRPISHLFLRVQNMLGLGA